MSIRKFSDLIAITLLTLLAVFVVQSGIQNAVRVAFALPLVFVFPGYMVLAAMFAERVFPVETQLVFSVALSIAITILSGLFLHFTWGLGLRSWLMLITVIILVSGAIAVIRRFRRPSFVGARFHVSINWLQSVAFGLAIMLTMVAIAVARNGAANQPHAGFTQLWMLPPASTSATSIDLGIRNEENVSMTYRLVVSSGASTLAQWETIQLAPGEQWEGQANVGSSLQLLGDRVEAQLYRQDSPDMVYRSVSFPVGSAETSPISSSDGLLP